MLSHRFLVQALAIWVCLIPTLARNIKAELEASELQLKASQAQVEALTAQLEAFKLEWDQEESNYRAKVTQLESRLEEAIAQRGKSEELENSFRVLEQEYAKERVDFQNEKAKWSVRAQEHEEAMKQVLENFERLRTRLKTAEEGRKSAEGALSAKEKELGKAKEIVFNLRRELHTSNEKLRDIERNSWKNKLANAWDTFINIPEVQAFGRWTLNTVELVKEEIRTLNWGSFRLYAIRMQNVARWLKTEFEEFLIPLMDIEVVANVLDALEGFRESRIANIETAGRVAKGYFVLQEGPHTESFLFRTSLYVSENGDKVYSWIVWTLFTIVLAKLLQWFLRSEESEMVLVPSETLEASKKVR